jgi:hypothetical protein
MTFNKRLNTILEAALSRLVEGREEDLQKAKILIDHGYTLIQGLYESGAGSIYQIIAYCKHPELWSPYKVIRDFEETDTYVLCWYFDQEYTSMNNSGRLIYAREEPITNNPLDDVVDTSDEYADLEDADEFEGNVDAWQVLDTRDFVDNIMDHIGQVGHNIQKRFNEIFKAITAKTPIDRWNSAPRTDEEAAEEPDWLAWRPPVYEDVGEYEGLEDADEFAEGLGVVYVVVHPDYLDDRPNREQWEMSADDLEYGLIRLFDKLDIQCVFVRDQQRDSHPVSISGYLSTDIPLGRNMPRPGPGEGVRIEIAGGQIPFMG